MVGNPLGEDELETHCKTAPLRAHQYRQLWLASENELGLIAETLAQAMGWQPSPDVPIPDPLELAQAAAERLLELEAQMVFAALTRREDRHLIFSIN